MQLVLFLVCTIPFLTSNIIRMISWVPFLGREGLLNTALLRLGLIRAPLEFLLFSDFAVVLAYVHLYTLFMVTPIFNTMMRIDHRLIEAAVDGGARCWQVIAHVVVPLCKPGIAIGSIFVVTLVMGDFITVRLMSGGQSASVGLMISNQISLLQYPGRLRQRGGAARGGAADDRGDPAHRRYQEGTVMGASSRSWETRWRSRAQTGGWKPPPPLAGGGWGRGSRSWRGPLDRTPSPQPPPASGRGDSTNSTKPYQLQPTPPTPPTLRTPPNPTHRTNSDQLYLPMTFNLLGRTILTTFFCLFVLFLYGPTLTIIVLSFQGPDGGLTFPMNGVSLHWFHTCSKPRRSVISAARCTRSLRSALIVMMVTVVVSLTAGLAFRRRFSGAGVLFYTDGRQPDRAVDPGQPRHRPVVQHDRPGSDLVQLRPWAHS